MIWHIIAGNYLMYGSTDSHTASAKISVMIVKRKLITIKLCWLHIYMNVYPNDHADPAGKGIYFQLIEFTYPYVSGLYFTKTKSS